MGNLRSNFGCKAGASELCQELLLYFKPVYYRIHGMGEQEKPIAIKFVEAQVAIEDVIGRFPGDPGKIVPTTNFLIVRFGDDDQKYLAITEEGSPEIKLIEVEGADEASEEMFRYMGERYDLV